MDDSLRYPIGRHHEQGYTAPLTPQQRETLIAQIEDLPVRLRDAVAGLSEVQLNTPYREGGWTVRQTVHHVADSHMNAYARARLALTEDAPRICAYNEAAWAELPDADRAPVEISLNLLAALHHRWAMLLSALAPEQFARRYLHPERGPVTLDEVLTLYAWHGRHHTAHIISLRERMLWR